METQTHLEQQPQAPVLSSYTDYKLYLQDHYLYKKKTESTQFRSYSYAHFSAAADIKSPNYLKLIIEGKRNLSDQMIVKFARALRLNKEEGEEFRLLVHYGQATDPLERNTCLKALSESRAKKDLASGRIDLKSWEKVPNWIGWVIYAMMDQAGVKSDAESLQRLFRSHVSLDQVKEALEKLVASGHIVQDPVTFEWKKNRAVAENAEGVPVELVRRLQSELIYLGLESLFRDSPKEREFGAFTLALTPDEFERVRFELRRVRKIIQKDIMMSREQSKGDRVYQLNIQLFPVTESAESLDQ